MDKMQTDHLGCLTLPEMAAHGVADVLVKRVKVISFGDNGFSEGADDVAPLGRFFDNKNDLVHERCLHSE